MGSLCVKNTTSTPPPTHTHTDIYLYIMANNSFADAEIVAYFSDKTDLDKNRDDDSLGPCLY